MNHAPVSLVIPTYNRGKLVPETIASALAQTVKFGEIIVIDDGSTDETSEVVQRFGDSIIYVKTNNQGVQAARNLGIAKARYDLIALCDSDDLLQNDYLEQTAAWMQKHVEQDLLFTNFQTFGNDRIDLDKLSKAPFNFLEGANLDENIAYNIPELYLRSIKYQPLFPSGLIIRRSFISQHGGYNPDFNGVGAEDWEFTLRAIDQGNVAFCKTPLVKIRKHGENDSNDTVKMSLGEVYILKHALTHHVQARVHESAIKKSISIRLASAFDAAYSEGRFDLIQDLPIRPPFNPSSAKQLLKKLISRLPNSLRQKLWKFTQA